MVVLIQEGQVSSVDLKDHATLLDMKVLFHSYFYIMNRLIYLNNGKIYKKIVLRNEIPPE